MFRLDGRLFKYSNVIGSSSIYVGTFTFDECDVKSIEMAAYDSDLDEYFTIIPTNYGEWELYSNVVSSLDETMLFTVPVYFEYIDACGDRQSIKEEYTVYGLSAVRLNNTTIKYIENIATEIGTAELITLHGSFFEETMSVFLTNPNHECVKINDDELVWSLSNDGLDDKVSFVLTDKYVIHGTDGKETCGIYEIYLGIGECGANTLLAGTGDATMAFENNIGLIRYKYNAENYAEFGNTAEGAAANTTDKACLYKTDMRLIYDNNDGNGNELLNGGAAGKYGKTMYIRIKPDMDCSAMRYFHVKVKYDQMLIYRHGEQILNGVQLFDGDIVWLSAQFDGTDGLWVVREGDWEGLQTLLEEETVESSGNPCADPVQVPLPVDASTFIDLGARVDDNVDRRCNSDVPVKYGSQVVCGEKVYPGDILLLTNQSDGRDGIWEVTCADWIFRGPVSSASGTLVDQTSNIIFQNDIDFCVCQRNPGKSHVFHIWYYYLNAGCYLASAVRTVKIICSGGTLFPTGNAVVTEYSIATGTESSLITDTSRTAGDPIKEDCVQKTQNYDYINRIPSGETQIGCGSEIIKAPSCENICNCRHYYTIEPDSTYKGSRDTSGFSIVFWQYGEGGWHLYAYIGSGRYDTGMEYYVYHLHTEGLASVDKVDVNQDEEYIIDGPNGGIETFRTKNAWFVEHGGKLSNGFGLVDDSWKFAVYNEYGEKTGEYTHILGAETMKQQWSIKCTTVFLANRTYAEKETAFNMRITCEDMHDAEKTDLAKEYLVGMKGVWGFKYYKSVVSKEVLVDMYNSYSCVSIPTWNALSTDDVDEEWYAFATDQCYDSEGNEVECEDWDEQSAVIIPDTKR